MQLIKSVLNGVQLYWSSVSILPKAVIKRVESIFSSFVWAGEIESHYEAKVNWKEICQPLKGGEFGINRSCSLEYLSCAQKSLECVYKKRLNMG